MVGQNKHIICWNTQSSHLTTKFAANTQQLTCCRVDMTWSQSCCHLLLRLHHVAATFNPPLARRVPDKIPVSLRKSIFSSISQEKGSNAICLQLLTRLTHKQSSRKTCIQYHSPSCFPPVRYTNHIHKLIHCFYLEGHLHFTSFLTNTCLKANFRLHSSNAKTRTR